MSQHDPLVIDTGLPQSRLDQCYGWVVKALGKEKQPTRLNMTAARTALSRKEQAELLTLVNSQLGAPRGFVARWSGRRNRSLTLRLLWRSD